MTTEDPKFKLIASVSTLLIISILAIYEARKENAIESKLSAEKVKTEEIQSKNQNLEKEHEKAKKQIEILQSKNRELEKSTAKPPKK
jgi:peptidoglycan hydrolase CwlO-like protein